MGLRAFLVLDAGLTEIKTPSLQLRRINRQRRALDMNSFSNHRAKRNTTLVALLVWVFALASGMMNACLLENPGKHAHAVASHSSDAHHAHSDGDSALVGDAIPVDHDDAADASKESCLKACDDGSNAQIKPNTGVDLTDPGLATFVVFAWNAATPVASAQSRFDQLQVPVVGPPFRLRYSRLTL